MNKNTPAISIRDHQRYRILALGAFVGAGSGIALQQIEFFDKAQYSALAVSCFLMAFLYLVVYFTVRIIEFNVEVCRVFLERAEEQIKNNQEPEPSFSTWYESVSHDSRLLKDRLYVRASQRARIIEAYIAVIIFVFSGANIYVGLRMPSIDSLVISGKLLGNDHQGKKFKLVALVHFGPHQCIQILRQVLFIRSDVVGNWSHPAMACSSRRGRNPLSCGPVQKHAKIRPWATTGMSKFGRFWSEIQRR